LIICFFFQAEDGIRDRNVTGVQTCALPISPNPLKLLSDILMIAAGLLFQTLSVFGRDPTSNAFFNTPGTERLYSGVTNKSASHSFTLLRKAVYSSGTSL